MRCTCMEDWGRHEPTCSDFAICSGPVPPVATVVNGAVVHSDKPLSGESIKAASEVIDAARTTLSEMAAQSKRPGIGEDWSPEKRGRALLFIWTLANAHHSEWKSKAEIWRALQEFKS